MKLLIALLALAVMACDHPSSGGAQASATSATASVAATTSSVAASASAATKTPDATRAWRGTYKSVASTLAPPDGKKTRWSDTQTTAGIGDGALALTVDGATGHVSGTVDGPLGPATIDGVVTDGKLAATLRRKDPTDQGFTGTILGSTAGDRLEGTVTASIGLANALRTATFTLTPSVPAP